MESMSSMINRIDSSFIATHAWGRGVWERRILCTLQFYEREHCKPSTQAMYISRTKSPMVCL
ncbi:hypothetical protein Mapa_013794 [Marchantia paleacea]|nr:hypothetical protein Mapa_013794 [Marchantia paleacea]